MARTKLVYGKDGETTVIVDGEELEGEKLKRWQKREAKRERENLAEMAATGKTPGAVTNDSFLGTRGTLADQFSGDPDVFRQVVNTAQANGYKPSANDVYLSSLADYVGDPKAFVSRSRGGRERVAEVCRQKGVACMGSVNVKGREDGPPADVALAPDLVQGNIKKMIRKNPELKKVDKRDLAAEAVKKHGKRKR